MVHVILSEAVVNSCMTITAVSVKFILVCEEKSGKSCIHNLIWHLHYASIALQLSGNNNGSTCILQVVVVRCHAHADDCGRSYNQFFSIQECYRHYNLLIGGNF